MAIVVSDSSLLIGLGRINQLDLLNQLFKHVIVPPAVAFECTSRFHLPGAQAIQTAINHQKIILHDGNIDLAKNLSSVLGQGEIESISLASQMKCPLLIDDNNGRTAAKTLNIQVIGTGGLLLAAKEKKIIKEVKPLLSELKASGYRLSETLIEKITELANE